MNTGSTGSGIEEAKELTSERCRRWNFETDGESILVCYDHHDKGESCDYERMKPKDIIRLIEDLRSEALLSSPITRLIKNESILE